MSSLIPTKETTMIDLSYVEKHHGEDNDSRLTRKKTAVDESCPHMTNTDPFSFPSYDYILPLHNDVEYKINQLKQHFHWSKGDHSPSHTNVWLSEKTITLFELNIEFIYRLTF